MKQRSKQKVKNNRRTVVATLCGMVLLLTAGCGSGEPDIPKPKSYLRIDMPEAAYTRYDTAALPFTFERNTLATVELKRNGGNEKWIDIHYPQYRGVVFLTYRSIHSPKELKEQMDTSYLFVKDHFSFSSGMDEHQFVDARHKVYGTTFHLKGNNVACTYQFYVTDSLHHFLRGAMYIDRTPNNDSLAPILDFIQGDLNHIIETIEWRSARQ